jgi:hypothetical protein
MNLLVPYIFLYDHRDPLFEEFTYGDAGIRGKKIKKLKRDDYLFFSTTIRGKKYITAYYVVDRVLDIDDVVKDKNIMAKYKNPHITEYPSKERRDECIVFGDPISSRNLETPLLFDRKLSDKLSLEIKFKPQLTETQVIGSATRNWRELTDKDVETILNDIKQNEENMLAFETVLSTDEVLEIVEKHLENFIVKTPSLIGNSLKLKGRQIAISVGRIDLLFEDKNSLPVVVELKIGEIGREAVKQVNKYMNWISKETGKEAKGIIVCKGVMPAFEDDIKILKNIKVFCYGWQLKIYPWKES